MYVGMPVDMLHATSLRCGCSRRMLHALCAKDFHVWAQQHIKATPEPPKNHPGIVDQIEDARFKVLQNVRSEGATHIGDEISLDDYDCIKAFLCGIVDSLQLQMTIHASRLPGYTVQLQGRLAILNKRTKAQPALLKTWLRRILGIPMRQSQISKILSYQLTFQTIIPKMVCLAGSFYCQRQPLLELLILRYLWAYRLDTHPTVVAFVDSIQYEQRSQQDEAALQQAIAWMEKWYLEMTQCTTSQELQTCLDRTYLSPSLGGKALQICTQASSQAHKASKTAQSPRKSRPQKAPTQSTKDTGGDTEGKCIETNVSGMWSGQCLTTDGAKANIVPTGALSHCFGSVFAPFVLSRSYVMGFLFAQGHFSAINGPRISRTSGEYTVRIVYHVWIDPRFKGLALGLLATIGCGRLHPPNRVNRRMCLKVGRRKDLLEKLLPFLLEPWYQHIAAANAAQEASIGLPSIIVQTVGTDYFEELIVWKKALEALDCNKRNQPLASHVERNRNSRAILASLAEKAEGEQGSFIRDGGVDHKTQKNGGSHQLS